MRVNAAATFSSISPAMQNKGFYSFAVDPLFASNLSELLPVTPSGDFDRRARGVLLGAFEGWGVRGRGANYDTGRTTGTLHFENSRPINRVLSGLRCLGESPRCDGSCCGVPGRYDARREKITLRG